MICCGAPLSPSRTSANGASARRQIESRCKQRLRALGARSADHADGASAPALVEQLHRARRSLPRDFQPGDIVAQLQRQVERSFRFAILRRKRILRLADRRPFLVERTDDPGGRAVRVGAQHLHGHPGRGIFRRGQRTGGQRAAFDDGEGTVADHLAKSVDEFRPAPAVDPVGQPRDIAVARRVQEAFKRRQRFDAVDREGFGASCRSVTRAVPAGISVMSCAGSDKGTIATPRRLLSASVIS